MKWKRTLKERESVKLLSYYLCNNYILNQISNTVRFLFHMLILNESDTCKSFLAVKM